MNNWMREMTGVEDVVRRSANLKWKWARHPEKWSGKIIRWRRPWDRKRAKGQPQMRRSDDLKRTAGLNWYQVAESRELWRSKREAYTQRVGSGHFQKYVGRGWYQYLMRSSMLLSSKFRTPISLYDVRVYTDLASWVPLLISYEVSEITSSVTMR
ncbi:hypothetical protein HHI36_011858 [Cryptolaemus montrouzieri]|uniref:Uncharacterized protein n=1 Tax=Cryptolaemus montrouzieri TaxID=559131 RepID=A0ABD2NDC0_9CUCU